LHAENSVHRLAQGMGLTLVLAAVAWRTASFKGKGQKAFALCPCLPNKINLTQLIIPVAGRRVAVRIRVIRVYGTNA